MKRNRFLSLLLAVMMLVTAVFPIGAFADDYDGWEEEAFASQEETCWDEFVLPEEVWDIIEEAGPSEEYVPEEEIWVTPEEELVSEQSSGEDAGAPEENLPEEQDGQTEEEIVLEAEDSSEFAAAITITSQPQDQAVKKDTNATFSVEATGNGLTYQWYYSDDDGENFEATTITTNTWTFKITEARNGRKVKCLIKDASKNKLWTRTATASIQTAPIVITSQPTNQAVNKDTNATFTVEANGSGLTYQWYYSDDNGQNFEATTITSNTWTFKITEARDGRKVKCLIKDANKNKLWSNVATARIKASPIVITSQPTNQSVKKDTNATFTVEAAGSGLTYLWYYRDDTSASFSASKVTTNSFTFKVTEERNGRQVKCLIKDANGNKLWSNVATASIKAAPIVITSQPTNQSVSADTNATFTVEATGNGLTYLWYYRDDTSASFSASKVTTNSFTFKVTEERNGRQVKCLIKDANGNKLWSSVATASIKVNPIVITSQPTNQTVNIDTNATFTVRATGSGLTYLWYFRDDTNASFSASKVTTNSFTFKVTEERNGRQVKCLIKDADGNKKWSNVATATATIPSVQITQQPSSVSVVAGSQASFTVRATGTGTLSYKWQEKTSGSSSWQDLSDSTSSTLSISTKPWQNGNSYRCVVTGSGATATSSAASLTVSTPTIYTGSTTATINTAGASAWYKFTPSKTGSYTLTSTGSGDPKCYLYNSSGSQLAYNDDSDGRNFSVSYDLTAGYTYYYQVRFYSDSATGDIPMVLSAPSSVRYRALLIGNDAYTSSPLNGCINDATSMRLMLSSLSNSFTCTQKSNLTASGITSAISSAFSGATENDVSLFYYSGHGMESSTSSVNGALVGVNYSSSYPNDYLTTGALASALNNVPGRIIVLLDSCRSGAAIGKGIDDPVAAAEAFNQSVIDAFAAYDSTVYVSNEKSGEMAKSKFIVITACKGSENSSTASLNSGEGCSIFTYYFVYGCGTQYLTSNRLSTIPADSNGDSRLTVSEIYNYTKTNSLNSNSGQTAQYYASNTSEVLFIR